MSNWLEKFQPAEEPDWTANFEFAPEIATPDERGWWLRNVLDPAGRGYQRLEQAANVAGLQTGYYTPKEAAERLIANEADLQDYPLDAADQDGLRAITEAPDFWTAVKAVIANPGAAANVFMESLPMMGPTIVGGAAGSVAGATAGPVGAMAGAGIGSGAGSFMVEYGLSFTDALRDKGVPVTREALAAAFSDPAMVAAAQEFALERGVPIAAFDALSFGVAGRISGPVSRAVGGGRRGAAAGATAELSSQAAMGSGGEATAQIASEGRITSSGDVMLEGMLELPGAAIEIPAAVLSRPAAQPGAQPAATPRPAVRQAAPAVFTPVEPGTLAPNPQDTAASPATSGSFTAPPEASILLAAGDAPEDIMAMSPSERAAAAQEALDLGVTPLSEAETTSAMQPVVAAYDAERPDSPRITPDDRASPIPTALIDDGKAEIDRLIGSLDPRNAPVVPAAPFPFAPGGAPQARSLFDKRQAELQAERDAQVSQAIANRAPGTFPQAPARPLEPMTPERQAEMARMADERERQARAERAQAAVASAQPGRFPNQPATPLRPATGFGAVMAPSPEEIEAARAEVNTEPTQGQAAAGNYKKAHVNVQGLDISIENPKGSVRTNKDPNGPKWSVEMPADYGYIRRTEGADGDKLDVYLGEMPDSDLVVIVNQVDPETGAFDAHKVILGTGSAASALGLYEKAFSDGRGRQRIGSHTVTTMAGFKAWLKEGDLSGPTQPIQTREPATPEAAPAKPKTKKQELAAQFAPGEGVNVFSGSGQQSGTIARIEDDGAVIVNVTPRPGGYRGEIRVHPEDVSKAQPDEPAAGGEIVMEPEFWEGVPKKDRPGGRRNIIVDGGNVQVNYGDFGTSVWLIPDGAQEPVVIAAPQRGRTEAEIKALIASAGRKPQEGNTPAESGAKTDETDKTPSSTPPSARPSPFRGEPSSRRAKVITPDGIEVDVAYEVVDARALYRAQDRDQPRDRTKKESEEQIAGIAQKLDPLQLLPARQAGSGAPIVGPNGVIESGNGRTTALIRVAESNPEAFQRYLDAMRAEGFDVDGLPDGAVPIVVGRRTTELDEGGRRAWVKGANMPVVASMSATEKAQADTDALTPETLNLYRPEAGFTSAANAPFINAFLSKLPQTERNALTTDGIINADGIRRVRQAIFARAYGDRDIVARVAEGNSDTAQAILNVLVDFAPEWAAFRAEVEAGTIRPEFDITSHILGALRLITKAREDAKSQARPVSTVLREAVAQDDIFGGSTPAETVAVVRMLHADEELSRAIGKDRIAERLSYMLEEFRSAGSAAPGLFGSETNVRPEEAIRAANRKGQTEDLFAGGGEPDRPRDPQGEPGREGSGGRPDGAANEPGRDEGPREGLTGPTIEPRSEKSIIVRGVSEADGARVFAGVKGALWNVGEGGWVFSKKREGEVRAALDAQEPGPDVAGLEAAIAGVGAKPPAALRADLKKRISAGATLEEMRAHPAVAEALRRSAAVQPTHEREGYGTEAWWRDREFTFPDGEVIVGVEKAKEKIADDFLTLAWREMDLEPEPVLRNREAVILLGPPAAGKSTIANKIAVSMKAAIIDSDEIKKLLPEFGGGAAANAVHEESADITKDVEATMTADGANIVYPKVGDSVGSIQKLTERLRAAGYSVRLVNMKVSAAVAERRMFGRFVSSGRLIPFDYIAAVGEKPTETYGKLKQSPLYDGYGEINNEQPFGQEPTITEIAGRVGTLPGVRVSPDRERREDAGGEGATPPSDEGGGPRAPLGQERGPRPEVTPPPRADNVSLLSTEEQDRLAALRDQFRRKLRSGNQLNAGLDPELVSIAAEMAGIYIKAGARKFRDLVRAMVEDLGMTFDQIQPYARNAYNQVRGDMDLAGESVDGMDSDADVIAQIKAMRAGSKPDDAPAPAVDTAAEDSRPVRAAKVIRERLLPRDRFSNQDLMQALEGVFGGTVGEGAFNAQDAYNALELALNMRIAENPGSFTQPGGAFTPVATVDQAVAAAQSLTNMLDRVPTQTRRDGEQIAFQQFSTPPAYAYAVNWIAGVREGDRVLEPSAGNGGIAVFALNAGAEVHVNEISERRLPSLRALGFQRVTAENAEQIANVFAGDPEYDVIVMNPPFSASGTRGGSNTSATGARHIEQALARLRPGGRLVAIMGHTFTPSNGRVRDFFDRVGRENSVRALVTVDGDSVYRKYGTGYDSVVLVIDKTPPTGVEMMTGKAESVPALIRMMEGVANEVRGPRADTGGSPDAAGGSQGGNAGGGRPDGNERSPEREPAPEPDPLRGPGRDDAGAGGRGGGSQRPSGRPGASGGGRGGGSRSGSSGRSRSSSSPKGGKPRDNSVSGDGPRSPADFGEVQQLVVVDAETGTPLETDTGTFASYRPSRVTVEGAPKHPAKLVEASAMASVRSPRPAYRPQLPKAMLDAGHISEPSLEQVVYAGEAHSQMLPDQDKTGRKVRRGYFIGDGTGVGKTRQIAGIIMDNWTRGRRKAVLLSKDKSLQKDARAEFDAIGMGAIPIADLGKVAKPNEKIEAGDGVMFTTYSTIGRATAPGEKSRVQQIVEWLGADFDGLIVFDEAHSMANALPIKKKRGFTQPSLQALQGLELQRRLPNARIVYASATGATEVTNLAYAERLGLWGEGTEFDNVQDFVTQIESGGLAAMEVVARDMKQMGLYLARTISFEGVEYDRVTQELTPDQRDMYDIAAKAWQGVLRNINEVIGVGDSKDSAPGKGDKSLKAAALAQFWGTHQRFFNQVLTAMQVPAMFQQMDADLADGLAPVIQMISTNEAATTRAISGLTDEDTVEDIDITPTQMLMDYVQTSFPIYEYEIVTDDQGKKSTQVAKDSKGNPIISQAAVAKRDSLLAELSTIRLPGNPLDMIIERYGVDRVAEVTGRSSRIVTRNKKRVVEKWSKVKGKADANAFQDGKRDVLVFSQAGGTGASYHADRRAKNQKRRAHYVLQAGWRADVAMQGLGRSHRSNQVTPPIYRLVSTDSAGSRRFVATIARRLDQLGALTKGQQDAGGGGMFSAADNLETTYGEGSVYGLFLDAYYGRVEGLDFGALSEEMGLNLISESTGGLDRTKIPSVPQFLNRVLSLTLDRQEQVFGEFMRRMESSVAYAVSRGTYNTGVVRIEHQGAKEIARQTVYEAGEIKTEYVRFETQHTQQRLAFEDLPASGSFRVSRETGRIYHFAPTSSITLDDGSVEAGYIRRGVDSGAYGGERLPQSRRDQSYGQMPRDGDKSAAEVAAEIWEAELAELPDTYSTTTHMITGSLLPVWSKLPRVDPIIKKIELDDGTSVMGRVIRGSWLNDTLKNLGVGVEAIRMTPEEMQQAVMGGTRINLNSGHSIVRRRVGGEQRMEVYSPPDRAFGDKRVGGPFQSMGMLMEVVNGQMRAFIPSGERGGPVLNRFMQGKEITGLSRGIVRERREASTSTPATDAQIADLQSRLDAILPGVRVEREGRPDRAGAFVMDSDGARVLIGAADGNATLDHEAIHALYNLGLFTDAEWEVLSRRARQSWIKRHNVKERYPTTDPRLIEQLGAFEENPAAWEDLWIEEAIAEEFATQRSKEDAREPLSARKALRKIAQFMEALGSWMTGQGFQSAADVFGRAAIGEVGRREGESPSGPLERNLFVGPRAFGRMRMSPEMKDALAKAKQMLKKAGADAAAVFRETGWLKGPDGKFRYEISDDDAKLKRPEFRRDAAGRPIDVRLEDILDHPELFRAHSWLAMVPVTFPKMQHKGWYGGVTRSAISGPSINIDEGFWNGEVRDPKHAEIIKKVGLTPLKTLLHEVQHVIQIAEGFDAQDSANATIEEYRSMFSEIEARAVERRQAMTPEERLASFPYDTETAPIGVVTITDEDAPFTRERRAPTSSGAFETFESRSARQVAELFKPRNWGALADAETWRDTYYVVRRNFSDKMSPLRRQQEAIQKAGGTVGLAQDAYMAESLYYGRAGERLREFYEGDVRGITQTLRDAKITPQEMDDFLIARHVEERNAKIATLYEDEDPNHDFVKATTDPTIKGGSGFSQEWVDGVMRRVAADPRAAKFREVARKADTINRQRLAQEVAAGLISQEQADAYLATYKHYTPLRGLEADEDAGGMGIGRGFDTRGQDKRAAGRTTRADSPLGTLLAMRANSIIKSEKNRVGKAFLRLAQANPNPAAWSIDKPETTTRIKSKLVTEVDPATGLPVMVRKDVARREKVAASRMDDHVLIVKVGGEEVLIRIENRDLASAMKNLNPDNGFVLTRALGAVTRLMSMLNTTLNIEWFVTNIARDLQTAGIQISDEGKRGLGRAMFKNWPKAMLGAAQHLSGTGNSPWRAIAADFAEQGGKVDYIETRDVQGFKSLIEGEISESKLRRMALAGPKAAMDFIQVFTGAGENAIRIAAYKAAIDAGIPKAKAASIARELTVNFNRKGELGPAINALYMFFNAAVQGNARLLKSAMTSGFTQKALGGLVLMGALEAMMGLDDEDEYEKLDAYVRERNLVLPLSLIGGEPGTFGKIPLPYGFNVFKVIGTEIGRVLMHGTDPMEAAANVGGAAINSFNPIGGQDIIAVLTPTVIDPLMDIYRNQNFFGSTIRPDYPNDPRPDSEKFYPNVSGTSRTITKWLNEKSGGNQFREGAISVSPENVDHLVSSYLGGFGRLAQNLEKTAAGFLKGDPLDAEKTPFIRQIYAETVGEMPTWRAYDSITDEVSALANEIKGFTKAGDMQAVREARARDPLLTSMLEPVKVYEKQLRALRDEEKKIQASGMPDDAKEDRIEAIRLRQYETQRRLLAIWDRKRNPRD